MDNSKNWSTKKLANMQIQCSALIFTKNIKFTV